MARCRYHKVVFGIGFRVLTNDPPIMENQMQKQIEMTGKLGLHGDV